MDAAATPPIIQLHPTRRCNLRCLHCYSLSGPEARDLLSETTLAHTLTDARAQGYAVASFSGGEPVLYPALGRLLQQAKALGMRTTVTSNGMLLDDGRLQMLQGCTDVLAISLDGVPASHNRMRGSDHAFDRMRENLDGVRRTGIDFGFIFTLTQYNVDEVAWAAQFAVEQGAKLFQIHPLEEVGRAELVLKGSRPDEIESAYAYLAAERIRQQYAGRLFVQLDVFHRDLVVRYPDRFNAEESSGEPHRLADCVTPLVVEADGTVVPLGYGFARRYGLGCVRTERLSEMAPRWIATGYEPFRELCRRVYAQACKPAALPFLNWYEMIGQQSADPASERVAG